MVPNTVLMALIALSFIKLICQVYVMVYLSRAECQGEAGKMVDKAEVTGMFGIAINVMVILVMAVVLLKSYNYIPPMKVEPAGTNITNPFLETPKQPTR